MRYFLAITLMMSIQACQSKEVPKATPVSAAAVDAAVKPEEDCDEKAKQKVEIKEDSISLTNPDAGCSLDDAQK